MRAEKSHLRTRIDTRGMNYKSFNVAAHEMGHNVEQTLSLNEVDYHLLRGVPNTAFTEAFAFLFQSKDLHLLDLESPDPHGHALKTVNAFWGTYEISGVALVDMAVWHWMYEHPDATPAELKDATLEIAKAIWNRYYASVFDQQDVLLLGVYSHMIDAFLYLPDYPIGHMIAYQIEDQMTKAKSIGREFERMAVMGRITPDLWMQHATGSPVGPKALLSATQKALSQIAA
jgi:oligoendopeptidase F